MGKKDTYYFPHDYGARNDPKLSKVLMKHGHAGKGIFWDLIEMMYEQGGNLKLSECEDYAFALRADIGLMMSIINDFGLFKIDGDVFYSESVNRRLKLREEKSEKAKKSAEARWLKPKENANASDIRADVLITDKSGNANVSEINAIKEIKGNKIKEKKKGKEFTPPSFDLVYDFFRKQSEPESWTEGFCREKARVFIAKYESDWDQLKKDGWQSKVNYWIATENDPETIFNLQNKLSDGRLIPDMPTKEFHRSLKTTEDRNKAFAKWGENGYYYRSTGKDSEIGWHKIDRLASA